jgi:hypothetical protein
MIRALRPAYLKPPDRGVPPPRSGLTSLAAEPTELPPVGLRGFTASASATRWRP